MVQQKKNIVDYIAEVGLWLVMCSVQDGCTETGIFEPDGHGFQDPVPSA